MELKGTFCQTLRVTLPHTIFRTRSNKAGYRKLYRIRSQHLKFSCMHQATGRTMPRNAEVVLVFFFWERSYYTLVIKRKEAINIFFIAIFQPILFIDVSISICRVCAHGTGGRGTRHIVYIKWIYYVFELYLQSRNEFGFPDISSSHIIRQKDSSWSRKQI